VGNLKKGKAVGPKGKKAFPIYGLVLKGKSKTLAQVQDWQGKNGKICGRDS